MTEIPATPLSALCNVSPAEVKIDLDELFAPTRIGKYARQQHDSWRHLGESREDHIVRAEGNLQVYVEGAISIDGGPTQDAFFTICDMPANGIRGEIITLDCHFGDSSEQYFVVIVKVNPYSCRDAEDNLILPYVARVHPRLPSTQHPLGDSGVARQMIINRHYGIS